LVGGNESGELIERGRKTCGVASFDVFFLVFWKWLELEFVWRVLEVVEIGIYIFQSV
jgi:hypothetical protein